MKNRPTFPIFIFIFTFLTIILNLLMLFITNTGDEDKFSNFFAIIITLLCFIVYEFAFKTNQTRKTKPEFYGILLMFSISTIRFANRLTVIPNTVNISSFIFFIGAGFFFIFVAISRVISNNKKSK